MNSNGNDIFVKSSKKEGLAELFSATSPVPNWMSVKSDHTVSDANKIIGDIKNLLNEAHKSGKSTLSPHMEGGYDGENDVDEQPQEGGSKKKSKSKKVSKPKKKGSSRKNSRASSRKSSRRSSKKGKSSKTKKVMKGGDSEDEAKPKKRGMPKAMQNILDLKKVIKATFEDLKDGPPMTVVASNLLKENDGDLKKASSEVKSSSNKSKIEKMYKDAVKHIAEKRAAKKAAKQANLSDSD